MFTSDDDFGIKIVWVKVKVEKSGLSWKINFTLRFFSFVDDAVLFFFNGSLFLLYIEHSYSIQNAGS